jgi:hypothetical protein
MEKQLKENIEYYNSLTDKREIERVELFAQSTFNQWAKITWVRFTFVYTNNALNRKNNRVGKAAGMRIGTMNLDLIPAGSQPQGRSKNYYAKAYFDVTRANATVRGGISSGGLTGSITGNGPQAGQWRSFRPEKFTVMTEIWSPDKQAWISKLSDFYRPAKRIK